MLVKNKAKLPCLFIALLFSISLNAWCSPSDPHSSVGELTTDTPDRIINVTLNDTMKIQFEPEIGVIKDKEVIQFNVINNGKINHEFSISDENTQKMHREMMRQMPNMEHTDHDTAPLKPGEKKEIVWKFHGTGPVVFSCDLPGHSEAGMLVTVPIQ
ncbi:MAG: multicopper oxidase domain-containing protein [Legionellales bacterium]|jgi:uncharacterized cupredoxin-like copper-binding protein